MIHVTNANYDIEVINSAKPVLLGFGAPWCVPCKQITKVMEELDREQTAVKMAKVDIEESPEIAIKLGVTNIPVIIFFKNGKQIDRKAGIQSKPAITAMINK